MDFLIRGSEYLQRYENFRLVGRDLELQRLTAILMRGRASSVILVGAGGVGCTSLCLGIQAAKQQKGTPFDLINKRLFWLDTNGLFASEQTNHSFHNVVMRLHRTNESILLIEDTKDFIEACRNNGTMYFMNALLSMVREKKSQIILETKDNDLDAVLRTSSDIKELFTIFPIEEPTGDALLKIVQSSCESLVKHHRIRIDDGAVTSAIDLTNKYRSRDGLNRAQPECSVTLIDRSLASYRLSVHKNPPGFSVNEWETYQSRLEHLYRNQREGEDAVNALEEELDNQPSQEGFQSSETLTIKSKIALFQKEIDRYKTEFENLTSDINSRLVLTRDLVLKEFSDISGIPTNKLNQDEIEKLRHLEPVMSKRIFGQEEVIHRVANGIKTGRVGRRNNNKPLAAYLFLGPSGVGKTELSKVLAGIILDDEAALTRFDMSEYMEKHAVAKLIGAPPGYEGFEVGGILTNLMRRNSYRVILFDEIEKAHSDIFNIMLQVLEDGRLTDNVGRTVSFADAIIIMTTNIGQTHFLDLTVPTEEANLAAMEELNATYRSEFLNRFAGRQNILCFKRLEIDSIKQIVRREIQSLDAAYQDRGIKVSIDELSLDEFCRDQYDPRIGARGLPGFISANLEPIIVNSILEGQQKDVLVRYDNKKLIVQ